MVDGAPYRLPIRSLALACLAPAVMLSTGVLGYAVDSPPERVFVGFGHLAFDINAYASFIQQTAREGRLLTENRHTTVPQKARYVFPYFVLVGLVERATGLPLPAVWYGVGYFAEVAFMAACASLASRMLPARASRDLFPLLLAYGGGLGFLPGLAPSLFASIAASTDLGYQRGITTLGSLWNPHGVTSYLVFVLVARELVGRRRAVVVAPLTALAVVNHAYTGILLCSTLVLIVPMRGLLQGRVGAAAALRELYGAWVGMAIALLVGIWQLADPGFRGSSAFFFRPAPLAPASLVLGLGGLLPLGLLGLLELRGRPEHCALLLAWIGATALITFMPLFLAGRFRFGYHLPVTIAAAAAWPRLRSRALRLAVLVLVFASGPFVVVQAARSLSDDLLYASQDELAASRALDSRPPGIVLSSLVESNRIAWLARRKNVYLGHAAITPDWKRKAAQVDRFFRTADDGYKQLLVQHSGARYVYWPRRYSEPGGVPGFAPILENRAGTLYERSAP